MKVMGILCMMFSVAALSLEFNRLRWCSIPATATIIEVNRQRAAKGGYTYNPVFEFCVDGRMIRGNAGHPGSLLKNQYQVGETRKIRYEKGNPENFRLRGNYTMILIGILFKILPIPVYGIGAGSDCDGQVILAADALGVYKNFTPKFAKKYCNIGDIATQGMRDYIAEVKAGAFPAPEHKYKFTGDKDEFKAFLAEYEKTLNL